MSSRRETEGPLNYELPVRVETLRRAVCVLLAHLEEIEGDNVALREDYFWAVSADDMYDVRSKPNVLGIRQLSESMANVDSMIADPDTALSYGLVWLADIFRAIGHQVAR